MTRKRDHTVYQVVGRGDKVIASFDTYTEAELFRLRYGSPAARVRVVRVDDDPPPDAAAPPTRED